MKKKVSQQRGFLSTAPDRLISEFSKQRSGFRGEDVLERLLTDIRMKGAWTELAQRAGTKNKNQRWWWWRIWKEIEYCYSSSKIDAKSKSKGQIKKEFAAIKKGVLKLLESVRKAGLEERLLYEFLPAETMDFSLDQDEHLAKRIRNLKGLKWKDMDGLERADFAYQLMADWPTLSALLEELESQAGTWAEEAKTAPRIVERNSRDRQTRYFVISLARYFNREFGSPLYGTVANIASAVFEADITQEGVKDQWKPDPVGPTPGSAGKIPS